MNYETITFNQLNNRAPNAYKEDIIPQSNEPKFAVCYLTENGKWWNAFESRDEQAAIAKSESMAKINPDGSRKIFLVVPEVQKPVIEEVEEVQPESVEVVEQSVEASTASTETPRTVADEVVELVAQVHAEESAKPVPTMKYLSWNKSANRYEAKIDGKIFCVDVTAFQRRLDKECSPSDDVEHVWTWLTRLSSWDFSGRQPGVYILGVIHA